MQEKIADWLLRQGVYNAIVVIDGTSYRLNRSEGLMQANEHDLRAWPQLECPFVEELRSAAEALGHPSQDAPAQDRSIDQ